MQVICLVGEYKLIFTVTIYKVHNLCTLHGLHTSFTLSTKKQRTHARIGEGGGRGGSL